MGKVVILIRNAADFDFGGAERFPVLVASVLQQEKIQPVIISGHRRLLEFADEYKIRTIRGWWLPYQNWSGWRALLTPLYALWQLVLFVQYFVIFYRLKPAAVHVQSKDDFVAATFAAKLVRSRVIWTDHADLKHIFLNISKWYKNPVGHLVAWSARFADHITVVSKSEYALVSRQLQNHQSILPNISVIYNGAFDTYSAYKQGAASETVTIGSTSRLVSDKGINELIDAYSKIRQSHTNTHLVLIGDGPERALFETRANGDNTIEFVGYKSDPLEALSHADIFVLASYHEGFSLGLVEASMLGKAIIATSVGGNPEIIIDGETGILVPPHDSEALEKALSSLLENDDLRITLGNNARAQYLERFQFDKIVRKEFIPLYEKTTD